MLHEVLIIRSLVCFFICTESELSIQLKKVTVLKFITIRVVVVQDSEDDLKWAVRKRLELLEHELFSVGRVTRGSLSRLSNGSKQQAGLDIAEYLRRAPHNMSYSLGEKAYLISLNFKPLYINTSPQDFLASQIGCCAEQVPTPYRDIDASIFRTVYIAVLKQKWVEIQYQSMASEKVKVKVRVVAPHTFSSDGYRWHMRAYDFDSNEFRDFVLGRIVSASDVPIDASTEVSQWGKDADRAWAEIVDLIIEPHPGFTTAQRKIVESDFQMEDGRAHFNVRNAHLFYVMQQFRLGRADESSNPAQQQIVLVNHEEIEAYLS